MLLTVKHGVLMLMRQADADLPCGVAGGDHQLSLRAGELQELIYEALRDTKKEEPSLDNTNASLEKENHTRSGGNTQRGYYKCVHNHYNLADSAEIHFYGVHHKNDT